MERYGLKWRDGVDEFGVELAMVAGWGQVESGGRRYGNGLEHHLRRLITLMLPKFEWTIYSEHILKAFCAADHVGVAGPASTGKSYTLAAICYALFCAKPDRTTVILASTTLDMLRRRIWSALGNVVEQARAIRPWLPAHWSSTPLALYSRPSGGDEHRIPVNAIFGVACQQGGTFKPISNLVGIKNETVIAVFDEANLMPRELVNASANLAKNPRYKFVCAGNPLDRYDALGVMCEPHKCNGGWDAYDARPATRIWRTNKGVAVQLSGLDTPNAKYPRGVNPFPWLIKPEDIEADREFYGENSWQFLSMNAGVFPTAESAKRIVTVSLCDTHNAFGPAVWRDSRTRDYVGVDLAWSYEDGDRSCLVRIRTGFDPDGQPILAVMDGPVLLTADPADPTPVERQLAQQVARYCRDHNIPNHHLGYDSTGRGTFGVELAAVIGHGFHPIEFGGKPDSRHTLDGRDLENERYGKKVSALWFAWRTLVVRSRLRQLPRSIAEEGQLREYFVTPSGREDVEPKALTRRRMGRSPDAADALVAAIETARLNGFTLQSVSGKQTGAKLNQQARQWRSRLKEMETLP